MLSPNSGGVRISGPYTSREGGHIMPLFGPPDVAKLAAKADVKGLVGALGYQKDRGVRTAAAVALGKTADARAVQPLADALRDPDIATRSAAAQALGEIGDAGAVEPLLAALRDPDGNTRHAAAQALAKTGDGRAVEPLLAALADQDVRVSMAAAAALGEIRDGSAVEPLAAILAGPADDMTRRMAATVALGGIGDGRAVEPLVAALADPNDRMVVAAAAALLTIGDGRAVEPIIAAVVPVLADTESTVRMTAVVILGRIDDPRAVEALAAAADDANSYISGAATQALAATGKLGAAPSTPAEVHTAATIAPPKTVTAKMVPAAAVVCDTFISFDSDEALNGFATGVMQSKWPGLQLAGDTHIEGAMGFSGSDDEAKTVLEDLLSRAAAAAALERADYEVTYFTARSEVPATKVWCMVALRR
jgi:HEAT repeat protein